MIIGLVILVVLALLGASAYSIATQDERLAGNARDHARAMDAAETMLRYCERYIEVNQPAFDGTVAGMFATPAVGTTWLGDQLGSWSGTTLLLPSYTSINSEWGAQPQCIGEQLPAPTNFHPGGLPLGSPGNSGTTVRVAHVTARGYGFHQSTAVTLVSYVAY